MNEENYKNNQANKKLKRNYLIGFILAVILTVISFGLVFFEKVSNEIIISAVILSAIIQMLVHLHYFLHINRSPGSKWNLITLAFTSILLLIFVGGTIWVMFTLNQRMM